MFTVMSTSQKKPKLHVSKNLRWFTRSSSHSCSLPPPTGSGHTCVVEEGGDEGAVLEEGVAGGDVFKVTLLKERILEHHRPHLQVHEPAGNNRHGRWSLRDGFLGSGEPLCCRAATVTTVRKPSIHPAGDSLVIEVLSLAVDLVFQGEVKGDVLYFLLDEHLGA